MPFVVALALQETAAFFSSLSEPIQTISNFFQAISSKSLLTGVILLPNRSYNNIRNLL